MGFPHELTGPNKSKSVGKGFSGAPKDTPKLTQSDLSSMLRDFNAAMSDARRDTLAKSLGVSAKALRAYGVGWAREFTAYSFPMYDGERKPCGIHLRMLEGGRKMSVPGSRLGLFIPDDYDPKPIPAMFGEGEKPPLVVVLPEGVTDCCAVYDLGGACAIGRPSNVSGQDQLLELLTSSPKQEVILIADRDQPKKHADGKSHWPGIEGALLVAEKILEACEPLRFSMPPEGAKDIRDWLRGGGCASAFAMMLLESKKVSKEWIRIAWKRIDAKRKAEG
jgi:hypothetical protein